MPIGGLVRLVPKPGAEQELLERASDVLDDVRGEPGNMVAILLRDPANPRDVLMFELFEDQNAIEAHHVAPHSLEKGPFVRALLAAPMEVQHLETI
ncbi:putative quinol monooxygenase [Novosphingobium album (ex Hu et al. 2023)]|uniref:Antibiotic biosynthesis monooxygenase n=1 Tax=Novosphingobium album (ex Hu et al. 2023) TaxID=2930093 RepID=A0ABT0B7M8_9SPHN|nr:putative quinol monooxygenase [Novosphingobium album (ex Hu et al. 2023)]MCJ2181046.1 antibiotic biosynthesis monooxygenase [Novosphingobium album (ex Hu et al. 2023)]